MGAGGEKSRCRRRDGRLSTCRKTVHESITPERSGDIDFRRAIIHAALAVKKSLRQHQLPPDPFVSPLSAPTLLKQLVPALRLGVGGVLHFDPGGLPSVSAVGAEFPLPHDAFEILRTR